MAVFWIVAPCNLVKFTIVLEALAPSVIRKMMVEAVRTSEMSLSFYQITRR
jgi:hypothetical protein